MATRKPVSSAAAVVIQAPSSGMDTASAPAYVHVTRCQSLVNMLPARPGKVVQRGPLTWATSWGSAGGAQGPGWVYGDTVLLVDNGDYSTLDLTSGALSAPWAGGPALAGFTQAGRLGSNVFGPLSNTISKWDGQSGAGHVTALTNVPRSPIAAAAHLQRIFVLGGSVPGTVSPVYSDRLYWTDPGWDGTDVLTAWQDDVSGLVNQIVFPDGAQDPAIGLVVLDKALLILRTNSILALYGTAPSNFALRKISDIGCVAPRSIVSFNTAAYFMSRDGFVAFDGARAASLSDVVLPDIQAGMGASSQASACRLGNQYIAVSTYNSRSTLAKLLLLHVPTAAWSEITAPDLLPDVPHTLVASANHAAALTSVTLGPPTPGTTVYAVDMTYVGVPEQSVVENAAGYRGQDDASTRIPSSLTTRAVNLAMPGSKSQLRRVMVDIVLQSPDTSVTATATLKDTQGNTIDSFTVNATTAYTRQQVVYTTFKEAADVQVSWALSGPAAQISAFEIHDLVIEFAPSYQRTG